MEIGNNGTNMFNVMFWFYAWCSPGGVQCIKQSAPGSVYLYFLATKCTSGTSGPSSRTSPPPPPPTPITHPHARPPQPGSVVVKRSPGMQEVGGSIPGRVKQCRCIFIINMPCQWQSASCLFEIKTFTNTIQDKGRNPQVNKWSKAISKRAFVYMGTHLWSKVARDLQNIVHTKIFVKRYKKLLLEKY